VTPRGRFFVGYFPSVESISDHGRPIDLADLVIEQGSKVTESLDGHGRSRDW
jgi:hypothetical protein